MMIINKLEWDSSFFNLTVGEAIINDLPFQEISFDNSFDVVYIKQNHDFHFDALGFTKTFQETKVNFIKEINQDISSVCDVLDFDTNPLENRQLYELAYLSGHCSRFLLDKNFGSDKFKELYRMWIDNSINKKFAKKIFYTKENNIITSFVTYQEYNDIGKIGLIATHPDFQGKGLGRKLLKTVEHFCKENNIKSLEIPTQKENINACKFYTSCGYHIKDELIIKHYWNNDTI